MENIFREYKTDAEFEMRPRLDFPAHVHDSVELIYVCRGGGNAFIGSRKYVLTEGSFFIAFPDQVHRYEDCASGEYIVLIVNPSHLSGLERVFAESRPQDPVCTPADDSLTELLKEALTEKNTHGHGRVLDAYLTLFFNRLIRELPLTRTTPHSDSTARVLRYCAEHYRENITIDSLSKALHLSRSSLSHIFSMGLRINFCRYINALRVSYALSLMEDGSRTVTEIAYLSGFSTIRTFNRAFLAEQGISPTRYMKEQKAD